MWGGVGVGVCGGVGVGGYGGTVVVVSKGPSPKPLSAILEFELSSVMRTVDGVTNIGITQHH